MAATLLVFLALDRLNRSEPVQLAIPSAHSR
jgi:hypothetical protein